MVLGYVLWLIVSVAAFKLVLAGTLPGALMQTLVAVLWTATILLEVKTQEDELWDPWADNCESMVPCNLTEPQTDPMPYIVTLNRPYINSDQAVYVYIRALPPLSFQGFMIQARDDKTGQAVGEFDTDNRKISIINCFGRPDVFVSQYVLVQGSSSENVKPNKRCVPYIYGDNGECHNEIFPPRHNPSRRHMSKGRTSLETRQETDRSRE
ncbi:hypothetical protein J6590_087981 [Homalodisca vitripennis]|nr:hypothetical protein J6590_087981 [Homalodisca vitripennis]